MTSGRSVCAFVGNEGPRHDDTFWIPDGWSGTRGLGPSERLIRAVSALAATFDYGPGQEQSATSGAAVVRVVRPARGDRVRHRQPIQGLPAPSRTPANERRKSGSFAPIRTTSTRNTAVDRLILICAAFGTPLRRSNASSRACPVGNAPRFTRMPRLRTLRSERTDGQKRSSPTDTAQQRQKAGWRNSETRLGSASPRR
jgi:hypothetical protein